MYTYSQEPGREKEVKAGCQQTSPANDTDYTVVLGALGGGAAFAVSVGEFAWMGSWRNTSHQSFLPMRAFPSVHTS